MARSRARVTGDKELIRQLTQLAREAPAICTDALDAWSEDVQDDARRRAPRLTGDLEDAINRHVNRRTLTAEVGILEAPGVGGSQSPTIYGPIVEKGNSRQDAQPYLQPAFEHNHDIRPYLRDALDRRLP